MSINLDDHTLQKITEALRFNPKVSKIILFGSRAKGTSRNGSDIDLAIIGNNITFKDICSLGVKIDELDLPYHIDLVDYASITNEELKNHIDRVGLVL